MSEVSPELEFLPEVYIGVVVYFIIVSRAVGKARYPWGFWPHRVHAHVLCSLRGLDDRTTEGYIALSS